MARHDGLSQWTECVSSNMPHLTKPQATVARRLRRLVTQPSTQETGAKQEEARRSGGSVATGFLLVLTADCKARNAPRFASPSAAEASESEPGFQ